MPLLAKVVKLLVDAGATVDARLDDAQARAALAAGLAGHARSLAAASRHATTVAPRGCTARAQASLTPLHQAAEIDDADVMKALLSSEDNKLDINAADRARSNVRLAPSCRAARP